MREEYRQLESLNKTLIDNNKELTEEIERLNSRYSGVGFTKKLEKQAEYLTAQIELLTECETQGHCYPQLNRECQGCKNSEAVKQFKETE